MSCARVIPRTGISHILFHALIPILFLTECSGNAQDKKISPYVPEQIGGRKVYIAFPEGASPLEGWPVVILLHGRTQSGGAWFGEGPLALGEQKFFPPVLKDSGFAVLAPDGAEPFRKGIKEWDFFHRKKENSKDLQFFETLFSWMEENQKPKFDMTRLYVAGISSGGFMTSRLAHAFPQKFPAVCVIAAGNADFFKFDKDFPLMEETGASPAISKEHPPTLILHGAKDKIIPLEKGEQYYQELKKAGVEAEIQVIPGGRHQWPGALNDKIIKWFTSHANPPAGHEKKDSPADELTFYREDSGKKIALRTGETFQVRLKGVPTAGYIWQIMELDQAKLKLPEKVEKSQAPPGMAGGSSFFTWRIQAQAPGECKLVIKYFRPWEGADKALETFSLDLAITGGK